MLSMWSLSSRSTKYERCPHPNQSSPRHLCGPQHPVANAAISLGPMTYEMLPNSKTLGPLLVVECCWLSFFFHLPIPVSQSHSAPGQPNEHCQLAPRWKPPPIRPSAKCGRSTTRQRPRRRPHQDLSSWAKHMRTKLVGDGIRGNVMPNTQKNCSENHAVSLLSWQARSASATVSPLRQGDILWPRTLLTGTWAAQPDHPTSSNCPSSGL